MSEAATATERVRCPGTHRWMPGRTSPVECPSCGQMVALTIVNEIRAHHVGTSKRPLVKVARRRRPAAPLLLQNLATTAGLSPAEYLVQVLEGNPTNEAAAAAIGVTRNTLWRWCKRLGVGVANEVEQ